MMIRTMPRLRCWMIAACIGLAGTAVHAQAKRVAPAAKVSHVAMPEPETMALLFAGLSAIGLLTRRRRSTDADDASS